MNKKLLNKRVVKKTVKDLREALTGVDDDKIIVLSFYYKGEVHHVYLSEILVNLKYDGVIKSKLTDTSVVELGGFDDDYSTYIERKNE